MIEVDAIIQKSDISAVGSLKGKVNYFVVIINDVEYASGSLVFEGFVGRVNLDDKLYHGVYRFTPAENDKAYESFSFLAGLPGFGKPLDEEGE